MSSDAAIMSGEPVGRLKDEPPGNDQSKSTIRVVLHFHLLCLPNTQPYAETMIYVVCTADERKASIAVQNSIKYSGVYFSGQPK